MHLLRAALRAPHNGRVARVVHHFSALSEVPAHQPPRLLPAGRSRTRGRRRDGRPGAGRRPMLDRASLFGPAALSCPTRARYDRRNGRPL